MRKVLFFLAAFSIASAVHSQSLFEAAAQCIKRYEGLHAPEHYPYVGYGHRLLSGEAFRSDMNEKSADSLLRADLLRKCRVFRNFGKDSLLLGVLSYNIGETKVLKSRLAGKLRAGDRDIYHEYVSFRLIDGKVSPALEKRRREEFKLLFND